MNRIEALAHFENTYVQAKVLWTLLKDRRPWYRTG
jgi:hypothetical protein